MATKLKILDGPGKFSLMTALFVGQIVSFTLEERKRTDVHITSVEIEDGSRESWLVKGWILETNEKFSGYFETRKKQGYLNIDT